MVDIEAKEYLKQLKRLDIFIQQRTDELNSLRELIGIHAIDYSSDRVQRSASADGIPNEIIKLLKLEKDIKKKIERFAKLKHKIINEIQTMDNTVYSTILYKRYVEYKSMDRIAKELNYSYRQLLRLHGYALQAFNKRCHTMSH